MLGKVEKQISFSDLWIDNKIPKNSYWYKMHDWVMNNLDDKMFQSLFSFYGRPSVSPVYTFAAILVQLEKGYSDNEVEEETTFDDRVKFAITAPRDFEGIDAVTLCNHRARFFNSNIGKEIFVKVLEKAKEAGMFSDSNLNIIDSFMIFGKATRQDTYTMLYQGIKVLLRICNFYGLSEKVLSILKRTDYGMDRRKPRINWEDKKEKIKLVDELVKDALNLIGFVKHNAKKENEDLIETAQMLEKIISQDTFMDSDCKYKITEGTAKDRIISVVDKEMRHGRKSSSRLNDGYKSEILTGGDKSELVLAFDTVAANVADGFATGKLLDEAAKMGYPVEKLYGDSSYCDWDEIEKRKEETDFCVKVHCATNKDGMFTKDDFVIEIDNGRMICPGGIVANFDFQKEIGEKGLTVQFKKESCSKCQYKENCTKSKSGRKITINKNERKLQESKAIQKTEDFKKDYAKRCNVERTISEVTKHGGRKCKYTGLQKTNWQILIACLNNNVKKFMSFMNNKQKLKIRGDSCLSAS